jgi:hypothetical protein
MLKSGTKALTASKRDQSSDPVNVGSGLIQRAAWPESTTPPERGRPTEYVASLADVGAADADRVDGKNHSAKNHSAK